MLRRHFGVRTPKPVAIAMEQYWKNQMPGEQSTSRAKSHTEIAIEKAGKSLSNLSVKKEKMDNLIVKTILGDEYCQKVHYHLVPFIWWKEKEQARPTAGPDGTGQERRFRRRQ